MSMGRIATLELCGPGALPVREAAIECCAPFASGPVRVVAMELMRKWRLFMGEGVGSAFDI